MKPTTRSAPFAHSSPPGAGLSGEKWMPAADGVAQLSAVTVANDFVGRVYAKLACVYDVAFGPVLQAGRRAAMARMAPGAGERILEVGVGTGINLPLYPADCDVTGIDLSTDMLDRARDRLRQSGATNARLFKMDAADLRFADGSFDIVYAPYVLSVVPQPVRVAAEMRRVCRPGGRIVLLNHFRSARRFVSRAERFISPLTVHIGFTADLDLGVLVERAGLQPVSIERVNVPAIWSLVMCQKDA